VVRRGVMNCRALLGLCRVFSDKLAGKVNKNGCLAACKNYLFYALALTVVEVTANCRAVRVLDLRLLFIDIDDEPTT